MQSSIVYEKNPTKLTERGMFRAASLITLLAGTFFLAGCSGESSAVSPGLSGAPMAVPVTVAPVSQKTVPIEVRAIGNVEAYSTVTVKSQVEGEVEQVHFREGQDVKQGDLLFNIDARPFEARLQQVEANLARDEAEAKNAQAKAARYKNLFESGIVSKDQFDQFQTSAEALDASVRADKAAVVDAKLQLGYCTIRSPIDGRTGSLLVHPGNIVKANDSSLLVINQIQPVYVSFSVPEQFLPEIKRNMAARKLSVHATVPDDTAQPAAGDLSFVNNTVDSNTGTIQLKGIFPNGDRRLWPGQFVNVGLRLTSWENATIVPNQAIQTGEKGQYVYVVKSDLSAELRPVSVGPTYEGDTVVEKGLGPGDQVVTDGQLLLYPGAKVEVKNRK